MSVPLDSLEKKVNLVLALCGRLDAENRELRHRADDLERRNQDLSGRIEAARMRLESLLPNLPEEA
ncbi:MAG: hypothetical protein JSR19_08885 [Proteobacteria bacterium]|nr:hypothetical protein [Pseudomonadota bacterium]HQR04459.1 hypothetical protein [Rhodocyclaceae bacterium]